MKAETAKIAKVKKSPAKKRAARPRATKKTRLPILSQPLVPMIAEMPAIVQRQVHKIFPKPLEFEFVLALLLLVITEMSLIILQ